MSDELAAEALELARQALDRVGWLTERVEQLESQAAGTPLTLESFQEQLAVIRSAIG